MRHAMKSFGATCSEFVRAFGSKMNNEMGEPMSAQAVDLLLGGWSAVGYLMLKPGENGKPPVGRKRVACSLDDARALEAWFEGLVAEGYVPVWRFYVAKRECEMRNSEFKGIVVHRAQHGQRDVIAEFILSSNALPSADFSQFAKDFSDAMRVKDVATQAALFADMSEKGTAMAWFSGDEGVQREPSEPSSPSAKVEIDGMHGTFIQGGTN